MWNATSVRAVILVEWFLSPSFSSRSSESCRRSSLQSVKQPTLSPVAEGHFLIVQSKIINKFSQNIRSKSVACQRLWESWLPFPPVVCRLFPGRNNWNIQHRYITRLWLAGGENMVSQNASLVKQIRTALMHQFWCSSTVRHVLFGWFVFVGFPLPDEWIRRTVSKMPLNDWANFQDWRRWVGSGPLRQVMESLYLLLL